MKNTLDNYVLHHNYGFGNKRKPKRLKKLKLKNEYDLKLYLNDIIQNAFCGEFKNNRLILDDKNFLINILS